MKNMLKGSNGTHFSARLLRSTAVLLTGVALSFALWTATAPLSNAQNMTPMRMIESNLPQGTTMANVSKPDFLSAVCAAVKKNRGQAPQIARAAAEAKAPWQQDILRTVFRCLGSKDCAALGRVLNAMTSANPDNASALNDTASQAAPNCANAFGGGQPNQEDEGNFGNAPGNQNPPPGSIGGGGGQGNVVAICHNGHTIFVSPQGAENHLNNHPGDTLGPCNVTPNQNQ